MNRKAELFIDCRCELGEGPIWNPLLKQLFWFDILNQTLFSADANGHLLDRYIFDHPVSAAAIIDAGNLLIAGAGGLITLNLEHDTRKPVIDIEADKPGNRSNDSRVHPSGALWIGTMSRRGDADPEAGAVYHYRKGVVTQLFDHITIPNSICFSPDGRIGYFSDTLTGRILKRALDPATGLPVADWELFADVNDQPGLPDGAVVDSEGFLWSARWGGYRVVRHAPDGSVDQIIDVPTPHVSCPAFGGADLKTLFITTAREHLSPEQLEIEQTAGSIFAIDAGVAGQPEPIVAI